MASLLEFCNQTIHIHLLRSKQSVKVTSALLQFCQISTRRVRHGGKHFIGPHPGVWLC
ncbi:hypothetical protein IHV84_08300 [Acidovorax sp. IB03]|uniref:hypothetical protein n=1 Tax=Acidovorax sp. IB03 TaxID=2779366 RepID=UPI0018E7D617|nr:hypothetical protein [Acidovorax sp. IB03]MBJ2163952.1 hypothetical protein [Acidovorax sp. IB03]